MVKGIPVENLENLVKIDLDSKQTNVVKKFLNNVGYPLSKNIPDRVWTYNVAGHGRKHFHDRREACEVILLDSGSVTFGLSSDYKTICDDSLAINFYKLPDSPQFFAYSEAVKEVLRNPTYQKAIENLGKKGKLRKKI